MSASTRTSRGATFPGRDPGHTPPVTFHDIEPVLGQLVSRAARAFGDEPLLVADGRRVGFAELDRKSRRFALGLLDAGVTKGTRLALLAPNSIDWIVAWSAAVRIGAVVVAINTFVRPPELVAMLRQSAAAQLVTVPTVLDHDFGATLEQVFPTLGSCRAPEPLFLQEAPFLRAVHFLGDHAPPWAHGDPAVRPTRIDDVDLGAVERAVVPADAATVVFTSGSAGAPKAVVHTHGTAVRYSRRIIDSYVVEPDDVVFSSMPFFWVGGLGTALLPCFHVGSTLVTQAVFEAGEALAAIEAERATIVLGWPQQGRTMAEHPSRPTRDLSSVRRTSMPDLVSPEQRPPAVHADTLGMTETFGSHSNFDPYVALEPEKAGTSGPALPGMTRTIVDLDTGVPLPPGEIGEIRVRGYALMAGLLGLEREQVFDEDGWYHTGDLGRVDDDDWIYFLGRRGEMIKTAGGVNVTPSEVEAALAALPDVLEAYVTGIEEPPGSIQVAAAVVLRAEATVDADGLRQSLRASLSAYKVPRRIWVTAKEDLPFLDSGKIDKPALTRTLERMATTPEAEDPR